MFRHPGNEYDQMTSDAAVDEAILINAYIFTETGQRAGCPVIVKPFLTTFQRGFYRVRQTLRDNSSR